jgi:hypothetical protein
MSELEIVVTIPSALAIERVTMIIIRTRSGNRFRRRGSAL